jgi:hypothetical protein
MKTVMRKSPEIADKTFDIMCNKPMFVYARILHTLIHRLPHREEAIHGINPLLPGLD